MPILGNDGTLLGIVREFDLLQAILQGNELSNMTKDTLANEIIHLLQTKHLIRVPVTGAEGKLVGIVARRDSLLGYLRATKPIWTF